MFCGGCLRGASCKGSLVSVVGIGEGVDDNAMKCDGKCDEDANAHESATTEGDGWKMR